MEISSIFLHHFWFLCETFHFLNGILYDIIKHFIIVIDYSYGLSMGLVRFLSNLGRIRRDGIPYFITAPSLSDAASENKFFFPRFTSPPARIRFRVSFSRANLSRVFGARHRKRRAAGDSCREFFYVPICCLFSRALDTRLTITIIEIKNIFRNLDLEWRHDKMK